MRHGATYGAADLHGMPAYTHRVVAAVAAVVASNLAAQDPDRQVPAQPDRPVVQIPSDHEGREPFELTLMDALRLGRFNNVGLRAEELSPLQAAEGVRVAEAFFEPEMFANANVGRSETPSSNSFQPEIQREQIDGSIGMRQRVATGALYELTFTPVRLRQAAFDTIAEFPETQTTMEFAARVTQPLLRGGWSASALADVHTAEARLAGERARFEREVQSTLIEIVAAYWELVAGREDYRVKSEAMGLAKEQLRITNERIRVRELAERDRVFDEAEVARRQEELIRADAEIRRREDLLRQLLFDDRDGRIWQRNLRPVSPFEGAFELPTIDWRDGARTALQVRPDIGALRAEVRASEIDFERARRDVLPQLDLVAGYSSNSVGDNTQDAWRDLTSIEYPDWNVGLQFSIPFGNNAARGARDRTMLVLEQSRRRLYAAELDVAREVRDALRDLETLSESIRAARESMRLSETQFDTERERLRVGRGTIFEVQQRNQEMLEARQRLLRNQLDYRISESRLLYVQGILDAPGFGSSAGLPAAER